MVAFGDPASQGSKTRPWEAAGVLGVASLGTAGQGMPSQGSLPGLPLTRGRSGSRSAWAGVEGSESLPPRSPGPLFPLPRRPALRLSSRSLARALCSSNNLIRFPRPPIEDAPHIRLHTRVRPLGGDPRSRSWISGSRDLSWQPPHPVLQPGQSAEGG